MCKYFSLFCCGWLAGCNFRYGHEPFFCLAILENCLKNGPRSAVISLTMYSLRNCFISHAELVGLADLELHWLILLTIAFFNF